MIVHTGFSWFSRGQDAGWWSMFETGSGVFRIVPDYRWWFMLTLDTSECKCCWVWSRMVDDDRCWLTCWFSPVWVCRRWDHSSVIKAHIFSVRYLIWDTRVDEFVLFCSSILSALLSEPITASPLIEELLIKKLFLIKLTVSEFSCRCFNPQRVKHTQKSTQSDIQTSRTTYKLFNRSWWWIYHSVVYLLCVTGYCRGVLVTGGNSCNGNLDNLINVWNENTKHSQTSQLWSTFLTV